MQEYATDPDDLRAIAEDWQSLRSGDLIVTIEPSTEQPGQGLIVVTHIPSNQTWVVSGAMGIWLERAVPAKTRVAYQGDEGARTDCPPHQDQIDYLRKLASQRRAASATPLLADDGRLAEH